MKRLKLRWFGIGGMKDSSCLKRREGFTLIELIIVLIIIGLAAGVVGIAVNRSSGSFEVKTLAKDLSAVLRYARNKAISEKKTYCFVIDLNDRAYKLYTDRPVQETQTDDKYVEVVNKPLPGDLQMIMKGVDSDTPFIEFFPVGNTTGGVIEISSEKGVVYYVTVNRITGKVDIEQGE